MVFMWLIVMGHVERQGHSRSQQLDFSRDSGQQRLVGMNTKSGIRLSETGFLTQFANCVTILSNFLLLIACSDFQRIMR